MNNKLAVQMIDDNLIGFIKSGKYRIPLLNLINSGLLTPSELTGVLKISLSQTSRTLKELADNELVTCKTPNRNKGKIYRITETGHTLLNLISGHND